VSLASNQGVWRCPTPFDCTCKNAGWKLEGGKRLDKYPNGNCCSALVLVRKGLEDLVV
jgi:hypothetical protein